MKKKTQAELEAMSLGEMVKYFNELTGSSVKKFSSKAAGLKRCLAAEPKKPAASTGERARKVFNFTASTVIKPHRDGTARAKAITALTKGATFEQVQETTGWKTQRACYEGIRLLNTHLGYGIRENDKGVIEIFTK